MSISLVLRPNYFRSRGRGRFKNAIELLNLRALKISMLYKINIFQCMGNIFCVEFQSVPWNSTQNIIPIHWKMCTVFTGENLWALRFIELLSVSETPPPPHPQISTVAGHQQICYWLNRINGPMPLNHDDVIKWKHFPRYWPFVRGNHWSPVNSPHKGQWRGALIFSLICALNKRSRKQSWGWWLETSACSLWRHCNDEKESQQPTPFHSWERIIYIYHVFMFCF